MTQKARNLAAALAIMAVSVYWFIEADGFRPLSALFPKVVAVIVFVIGAILTAWTLFGHGPVIRMAQGDASERHARAGTLMAALVLWTALIPLVGLLVASVIGVVVMGVITFRAHVGTIRAIIIALVFVLLFYVLFQRFLHVPFPAGVFG
ncbi:MAG: tripartite tricarboxylate transporter TctB family protein [Spirochaetota bacterium]